MSRSRIVVVAIVGVLLLGVAVLWSKGGTPQFYATEVEVRAAADQVFPYLVEPDKLKAWISGFIESRAQTQNGPEVGAKSIEVFEREGNRVEIETEIVRLEKSQLLQVKMHSPFFDAVNHLDLTPTAGGTKITQNLTITYKGLARFFAPFAYGKTQEELESDLKRLKDVVDKPATAVPPASP